MTSNTNTNTGQTGTAGPSLARKRWTTAIGKVLALNRVRAQKDEELIHHEGLIEEIKKAKQRSKVKESVLSILKSQANLTQKVFERQKYSAKEMLLRKRAASSKSATALTSGRRSRGSIGAESIAEYNRQAQIRYKITPEIREKLDKIKAENDAAEERMRARAESKTKPGIFWKLFNTTIIGQTLRANPRFYKMDPHEHLPELCRRCRRPLVETLESRFTSIGILFCIFFPIIGILLLYANREFICVICEEVYVYGELSARPEEDDEDDELEEHRKIE